MGAEQNSSKFIMFAKAFLEEALEDLDTAKELLESERYSKVVFHSQQCAEKAIKALFEMEKIFIAEHDLSSFFVKFILNNKNYAVFKNDLKKIQEILVSFEGEWKKTRYPREIKGKIVSPRDIYDFDIAQNSIDKAGDVLKIVKNILIKKFKLNIN